MKKKQIEKILITAMIATLLMFVFEIIFDIPVISNWISNWVISQNDWLIYLAIWIIMFLQVTIIPIPAVIVLTASIGAGIINASLGLSMFGQGSVWIFIAVTISAYMLGAIIAYLIGRRWGRKAVEWCAGSEEDYNKWSNFLNKKGSKWLYAATVVLPIFPDDLLCVVAGSVKFNFSFWFWCNLIGRTIGLICMLGSLVLIGAGGSSPLAAIAWGVALLVEFILYLIIKFKKKDKDKEDNNESSKDNL